MKRDFNIGEEKINVNVDFENGIIKLDNMIFYNKTDFIYYVNKLTDIAEELLESKEDK